MSPFWIPPKFEFSSTFLFSSAVQSWLYHPESFWSLLSVVRGGLHTRTCAGVLVFAFWKCSHAVLTGCQIFISCDLGLFLLCLFIASTLIMFYLWSFIFLGWVDCFVLSSLKSIAFFFLITSPLTQCHFHSYLPMCPAHELHIVWAVHVSDADVLKRRVENTVCWCFSEFILVSSQAEW